MPTHIQGFAMPRFPSTWYHPVQGAKEVANYDEWLALDDGWKATAGEADIVRTEMQAQLAIASGAADAAKKQQAEVVRNSAQNEEDMKRREAAAAAPPAQEPKREPPPAEHKPEQPQEDHRERRR